MKSVHLVIATGQTQANLISLLQFKPDVIVLAVSEDMENTAYEFEQLLKRTTPETLIKIVHGVPSVGIAVIEAKAVEIENELQSEFPDSMITYHATGGTKLMTLGFYNAFAKQNHRIIYTDTAHNQIEIVYPRGQAAIAIEYTLDVRTYLRSLGFTFQNSMSDNAGWTTPAEKRQPLSQWLAENSQSLDVFLGEMNKLAANALNAKENGIVEDKANQLLKPDFANEYSEALAKLNAAGILQWSNAAPNKITFKTANNTKYIKGFWLEEYVWLMAQNLGLSEVKSNITFGRGQEATKNEMDCIAIHNNRLLAIECKTVALDKKDAKDTNQILYKLEALGKGIGGLYHEKWLISARPLEVEQRAKNAQIKIITPEQLPNLKNHLENWRDKR